MERLEKAIEYRKQNQPEACLKLLLELLDQAPEDPKVNYQIAWTYDSMGKESSAVPYYERAIAMGLQGEDLNGALLGLGSTFRCLGEYQKSLQILNKGISLFPEDRSLKIFRALTLYNLGKKAETVEILLQHLLDTTNDENIRAYEGALRFYSNKLEQTWIEG